MKIQNKHLDSIIIHSEKDIAGKCFSDSVITISSSITIRRTYTHFNNCILKMNSSGASCIYVQDGTLEITNCRFELSGVATDGFINIKESYLKIDNSSFNDLVFTDERTNKNDETCFIYMDGNNNPDSDSRIELNGCSVTNCSGHLITANKNGFIHIQNCSFRNHTGCVANLISHHGSDIDHAFTVEDSVFKDCVGAGCSLYETEPKRQSEDPFDMLNDVLNEIGDRISRNERSHDYLIHSNASWFTIRNCKFKNISGGIVLQSTNAYPRGFSRIESCSFKNVFYGKKTIDDTNEVFREGRIIDIDVTDNDMIMTRCTFKNVGSIQLGSFADYSCASRTDVSDCTFDRLMGKLILEGGTLQDCHFIDCHTFWRNRDISLDSMSENSLITICGSNQSSNRMVGSVSDCTFQYCTAGDFIIVPKSYLNKPGTCISIKNNSFTDCETIQNAMYRNYDLCPKTIGSGFRKFHIVEASDNQISYTDYSHLEKALG